MRLLTEAVAYLLLQFRQLLADTASCGSRYARDRPPLKWSSLKYLRYDDLVRAMIGREGNAAW